MFDDGNDRVLDGYHEASMDMTVQKCLKICKTRGFKFSGLQWQIECYCGHEPDSGFIWSWPNNCNEKCAGDSNQNCGGSNAISIWSTPPSNLTGQCFYDFPSPPESFRTWIFNWWLGKFNTRKVYWDLSKWSRNGSDFEKFFGIFRYLSLNHL